MGKKYFFGADISHNENLNKLKKEDSRTPLMNMFPQFTSGTPEYELNHKLESNKVTLIVKTRIKKP